jgi:hypothetical protein
LLLGATSTLESKIYRRDAVLAFGVFQQMDDILLTVDGRCLMTVPSSDYVHEYGIGH